RAQPRPRRGVPRTSARARRRSGAGDGDRRRVHRRSAGPPTRRVARPDRGGGESGDRGPVVRVKAVDEILTRWREDAREWSRRQRTASDACVECWSWPLRTALPVDTPNALVHRLRQAFDDSVRLESARHMERLAVEYATDDVDALFEIDEALDRIVSFEQD